MKRAVNSRWGKGNTVGCRQRPNKRKEYYIKDRYGDIISFHETEMCDLIEALMKTKRKANARNKQ